MVKVAKPLRISTEFSHELAWEFHPLPTLPSARQFARSDGLLEGSLKTGSTGNTPQWKERCGGIEPHLHPFLSGMLHFPDMLLTMLLPIVCCDGRY